MADDRPAGVDYSSFSFDDKMRVYYSAPPTPPACARAPGAESARVPPPLTSRPRPRAGKLFPYEPMHQWLSYGGSDRAGDAFSKREFSFTLANDIYIRSALRAALQALARRASTTRYATLWCVRLLRRR